MTEEKAYGMTVTMMKSVKSKISTVGIISFMSWKYDKLGWVNIFNFSGTRLEESFLEPIVVPKANLSEMYNGVVNQTAEFLFDFEYSESQVMIISFIMS